MGTINPGDAREALAHAEEARSQGARSAARPAWYYPALGACLFIVFASFSLDMVAVGVALGAVVGPVTLELLARQSAGASPYRSYTAPGLRGWSIAFVLLVLTLLTVGLALERGAEVSGAMAACGLAVLVVTVVVGRRIDGVRAGGRHARWSGA